MISILIDEFINVNIDKKYGLFVNYVNKKVYLLNGWRKTLIDPLNCHNALRVSFRLTESPVKSDGVNKRVKQVHSNNIS